MSLLLSWPKSIVCVLSTAIKGNTTEAAVLKAFLARGWGVLVPFGGGEPFDLVVHLGSGEFLRVQCKTARLLDGCMVFNGRSRTTGAAGSPTTDWPMSSVSTFR